MELDALDVDLIAALRDHTRVGVLELSRGARSRPASTGSSAPA
jgi:hypothetical protein